MPEDLVFEDLVKRDNGKLGKLFPVFSITAFILFAVIFNLAPIILFNYNGIYFTGMLTLGVGYLVFRAIKNLNIEFEYEILNDMMTFTKILNGKKRIVLTEFSIRNCEFIGPVTEDRFIDDADRTDFSFNCTGKRDVDIDSDMVWYTLVSDNSGRYAVFFDFSYDMYPIFRRYNAHRTAVFKIPEIEEERDEEE